MTLTISVPNPADTLYGFGAELDPYYWQDGNVALGSNQAGWDIHTARIKQMGFSWVRMMMNLYWVQHDPNLTQWDWNTQEAKSLLKYLDFCQANNIKVFISDWGWSANTSWNTRQLYASWTDPRYANGIAAYLEELITKRGYTCIEYIGVINEPNEGNKITTSDLAIIYHNLSSALPAGLVKISSPDYTSWTLGDVIQKTAPYCQVYDFHYYPLPWEMSPANNVGAKAVLGVYGSIKPTKQFASLITELGLRDTPSRDDYSYGVDMGILATHIINQHVGGASAWISFDVSYGGTTFFNHGLWKSVNGNFAIRPWAQAWSLFTRFVPRDSVRAFLISDTALPNTLYTAAVVRPGGKHSAFFVNQDAVNKVVLNSPLNAAMYAVTPTTLSAQHDQVAVNPIATVAIGDSFIVPANSIIALIEGGGAVITPPIQPPVNPAAPTLKWDSTQNGFEVISPTSAKVNAVTVNGKIYLKYQ